MFEGKKGFNYDDDDMYKGEMRKSREQIFFTFPFNFFPSSFRICFDILSILNTTMTYYFC